MRKIDIFIILVANVMIVNSLDPEPDLEVWETKCHRTQVEQYIYDWVKNGSLVFLPRLRTLKTKYPGDRFYPTRDSACDDLKSDCKVLAARGQCTGSDSEVNSCICSQVIFIHINIDHNFRLKHQILTIYKNISRASLTST